MDYAGVVVDIKAKPVDRLFHYTVPQRLRQQLTLGHRVLVPFGRRHIEGYVVEFPTATGIPLDKLRDILDILDPVPILHQASLATARWMASYYQGYWVEALQNFLPPGSRYGRERAQFKWQTYVELSPQASTAAVTEILPANAHRQREVLAFVQGRGLVAMREIVQATGASHQTIAALVNKGLLSRSEQTVERQLAWGEDEITHVDLTAEQEGVLHAIAEEWRQSSARPILLHGVTGSGKTEIYLRLLQDTLKQGKQGIVMVPEIALTPQTVSRFRGRFGPKIAVLHSGLSVGERFEQWWKIRRGQVNIAIGARSAVFAPFPDLGIIIIDEEHETTYKQEEGSLKYHARDTALCRAQNTGARVVLGSATPSLESYQNALRGTFLLTEMPHRVEHRAMPRIVTVDMRREFAQGHRHMFSRPLQERLQANLDAGHQSILFLNRRGFASFVLCRSCGHVMECTNCKVSLTLHKSPGGERLHCHYCGVSQIKPQLCPECGSQYLRAFGSGTQQVEEALLQLYPDIRSIRMDADTTNTKGAHRRLLDIFRRGDAEVLIGTQMIAKGLDFPNVTLVGVLAADLSLNFPDFRSAERTFQLLTQISGRAGRGAHPGDVLVQCYEPNHHVIQSVKRGDFKGFYRREVSFRREAGYPPTASLSRILCAGPEALVRSYCETLAAWLQVNLADVEVMGPSPAPVERVKGRHRWHILLRYRDRQQIPEDFRQQWPASPKDVALSLDMDPLNLL